jgi:hypothetical protein
MLLLQTQKNQVYELIEDAGLSPSMFSFDDPNDADGDTYLRYKDSNYYFNFAKARSGGHFARYSPGYDTPYEDQAPGSWNGQLSYVRRWLSNLVRELEAPDKWKLLQEEIENMDFGDIKYEDTKFTYREYELLKEKISELKVKIGKLDLVEEQIKQINEKLDHLLHLAKDMNKTDWKELFIGSLIGLFMQLSIDKDTGQAIAGYVKGLFMKFLPSGG